MVVFIMLVCFITINSFNIKLLREYVRKLQEDNIELKNEIFELKLRK